MVFIFPIESFPGVSILGPRKDIWENACGLPSRAALVLSLFPRERAVFPVLYLTSLLSPALEVEKIKLLLSFIWVWLWLIASLLGLSTSVFLLLLTLTLF